MLSWNDIVIQRERYADLRREADKYRFARQALAGHQARRRLYRRAMNGLGRRLVARGVHRQKPHSTAA